MALVDFDAYQRMAIDYALLRLSPDSHPMQFLRVGLGEGVLSSRHLQTIVGHQAVEVAGLVVCRQQPMTARGIVFLLLEDEFGMVNVLVKRELVAQARDVVQLAQFIVAKGELEVRAGSSSRSDVATSVRCSPADALAMPKGKNWA